MLFEWYLCGSGYSTPQYIEHFARLKTCERALNAGTMVQEPCDIETLHQVYKAFYEPLASYSRSKDRVDEIVNTLY